jgi:hypothetical protein
MERFPQGPHSIGFVAAASVPLALLLRRRLGSQAWLLIAGAGLTHLLRPGGRPPAADRVPALLVCRRLFHAPVAVFQASTA